MGILKTGISAIGKLLTLVVLAGAFLVGAVCVVYLSLRGEEVKVPEVVGKDFYASEGEIAALGLKLKKRATRYSEEKPNTVLEQLPKPGETVKTGQTISVVVSEANPEGSEAPATIKKNTTDEDDSTDLLQDQPAKSNKNSNTKKPSQTTRDVIKPNKNANSNTAANTTSGTNSGGVNTKSDSGTGGNKNSTTPPGNKSTTITPDKPETVKPNQVKPTAAKTPLTGGDTRTRKVQ